jgi:SPP1 gp7 family putative phage head morphogenesis protein
MSNINERVEDALTKHDLALVRYANGRSKDAITEISKLQAELLSLIKDAEPNSKQRLNALLDRVNQAIDRSYSAIALKSIEGFKDLAIVESEVVSNISQKVFRAPIAPNILGRDVALEIVDNGLAPNSRDGLPIRQRWTRQRDGLKSNTKDALNYAIQNNQSLDEMLNIIRGNRSLGYRDGVVAKSKKGAETLIRTATDTVVNASRLESYKKNSKTIKGIQANAILDNRTSLLCRTRNGWAWHLETGKPFRGTPQSFMGPPPWHFNCRTTLAPIFKSIEDLQAVTDPTLNEAIAKTNKNISVDGRPAPIPSFKKTFDRMGKKEQESILGKGRYDLYKKGKITLSDLVNQQGKTLTLTELKEKYGT